MNPPCMYGFNCPYRSWDREGDALCTYPELSVDALEGEYYPLVEESGCTPMNRTDLELILWAYEESEEVQNLIQEVYRKSLQEVQTIFKRKRK